MLFRDVIETLFKIIVTWMKKTFQHVRLWYDVKKQKEILDGHLTVVVDATNSAESLLFK